MKYEFIHYACIRIEYKERSQGHLVENCNLNFVFAKN